MRGIMNNALMIGTRGLELKQDVCRKFGIHSLENFAFNIDDAVDMEFFEEVDDYLAYREYALKSIGNGVLIFCSIITFVNESLKHSYLLENKDIYNLNEYDLFLLN